MSTRLSEHVRPLLEDSAGIWHRVGTAPCDECGCEVCYSLDEPGIWWDPGHDIAKGCVDARCECHTAPVRGVRFALHAA